MKTSQNPYHYSAEGLIPENSNLYSHWFDTRKEEENWEANIEQKWF